MTDSDEYRLRIVASGRRAGRSARLAAARAEAERSGEALVACPTCSEGWGADGCPKCKGEVLGVLTGQVPVRSMPVAACHCSTESSLVVCPEHGLDSPRE